MDYMIWVVAIALFGYVAYSMYTAPPSSGCLSRDLARALDEQKQSAPVRSGSPAVAKVEAPLVVQETPDPDPEPAAEPAAAPSAAPVAEAETQSAGRLADQLRNPATGETVAAPTNYRFAKRWIKEAMVAEGLLDKIYGTSDLDAAGNEKVRAALAQFRALEKYHA